MNNLYYLKLSITRHVTIVYICYHNQKLMQTKVELF